MAATTRSTPALRLILRTQPRSFMKFQPTLLLVDLYPALNGRLVERARKICRAKRQRCRGGRVLHDWRDTARRYLIKIFPNAWIYTGGSHVAVHASAPERIRCDRTGRQVNNGEAGACLFRVIEINTIHDARANGLAE